MEPKRQWSCVFLVAAVVLVAKCQNECDNIRTFIAANGEDGQDFIINATVTAFCIQCVDQSDGSSDIDILWTIDDDDFPDIFSISLHDAPPPAEIAVTSAGLLLVADSTTVVPLGGVLRIQTCFGVLYSNDHIDVLSSGFVPPVANPSELTLVEGGSGQVVCDDSNFRRVDEAWTFNGMTPDTTNRQILTLNDVTRDVAGTYRCQLSFDGEELEGVFVDFELTVHYLPEATTTEDADRDIFLGGELVLTCDFDGLPTPSVTWLLNNTAELDPSADGVTITTESGATTLTIASLGRDGGGLYSCNFNNTVGEFQVNTTVIHVLIPPAAPINLTGTPTEYTISLTWVKGFDGNTPITGTNIEYSNDTGIAKTQTLSSNDPTSLTIEDLTPFTNYTISVQIFNAVGGSDISTFTVITVSLPLNAPVDVTVTALSSEELRVSWNPAPTLPTMDAPDMWTVEFSLVDANGMPIQRMTTDDGDTLMVTFDGLQKGTQYQARVVGTNVVGLGAYSDYVVEETDVDAPTMPREVTVEGITAEALYITWVEPIDNGGRPVTIYTIVVDSTMMIVLAPTTNILLKNEDDEKFLMENTTYTVEVSASNVVAMGQPGSGMGTTQSIKQPQAILEEPIPVTILNTSATVTWVHPGGTVEEYLIQFIRTRDGIGMNVSVSKETLTFNLTNLETGTTYIVGVFSVNSLGTSAVSPFVTFNTASSLLGSPPPVVAGPNRTVFELDEVVLTCTSPDTKALMWYRDAELDPIMSPRHVQDGDMSPSTLTINHVTVGDSGVYICRVGSTSGSYTLHVTALPNTPPTIIIAASAAGCVLLLICFCLAIFLIACYCCRRPDMSEAKSKLKNKAIFLIAWCCCKGPDESEAKSKPKNKDLKPDKRTKELFEVSTNASYAPIHHDANQTSDIDGSFNMPEDYPAHSSFNTLDKPPKRSTSPDQPNTSSFGVALEGGKAYQVHMPPSYDD